MKGLGHLGTKKTMCEEDQHIVKALNEYYFIKEGENANIIVETN